MKTFWVIFSITFAVVLRASGAINTVTSVASFSPTVSSSGASTPDTGGRSSQWDAISTTPQSHGNSPSTGNQTPDSQAGSDVDNASGTWLGRFNNWLEGLWAQLTDASVAWWYGGFGLLLTAVVLATGGTERVFAPFCVLLAPGKHVFMWIWGAAHRCCRGCCTTPPHPLSAEDCKATHAAFMGVATILFALLSFVDSAHVVLRISSMLFVIGQLIVDIENKEYRVCSVRFTGLVGSSCFKSSCCRRTETILPTQNDIVDDVQPADLPYLVACCQLVAAVQENNGLQSFDKYREKARQWREDAAELCASWARQDLSAGLPPGLPSGSELWLDANRMCRLSLVLQGHAKIAPLIPLGHQGKMWSSIASMLKHNPSSLTELLKIPAFSLRKISHSDISGMLTKVRAPKQQSWARPPIEHPHIREVAAAKLTKTKGTRLIAAAEHDASLIPAEEHDSEQAVSGSPEYKETASKDTVLQSPTPGLPSPAKTTSARGGKNRLLVHRAASSKL